MKLVGMAFPEVNECRSDWLPVGSSTHVESSPSLPRTLTPGFPTISALGGRVDENLDRFLLS